MAAEPVSVAPPLPNPTVELRAARIRPGWPWLVAAAAAVCGLLLLRFADPRIFPFYPKCMFRELTGLYCSGCGSTRMAHALVHGDVTGAFRANPLTLIFILYFLYEAVARGMGARGKKGWPVPRWTARRILALAAALVIYTVARNLPWAPFVWLAPV